MSLPNYLTNIKSSGIYRFVWDKSQVTAQTAETLRLVVGYSEKGPFNTPVYVENTADFISIYGNVSKRLEKRGIFFHRMALQALSAGPILALNIKPFTNETVECINFNCADVVLNSNLVHDVDVKDIYDTNRFWTLSADGLPKSSKYINIFATDVKESSCTIFVRPVRPSNYDITLREWFNGTNEDPAEYLDLDQNLADFFAEVYVFRGEWNNDIIGIDENGTGGVLSAYFDNGSLKTNYTNVYGELVDALEALSLDPNSNFVGKYRGCTIPNFKDAAGNYISLDLVFNSSYNHHKMLMHMDEAVLDNTSDNLVLDITLEMDGKVVTTESISRSNNTGTSADYMMFSHIDPSEYVFGENYKMASEHGYEAIPNLALKPIFLSGYEYKETIKKGTSAQDMQTAIINVLKNERGIHTALTNRVDVEYHYIVDTFQSYINSDNKEVLASIAKEKGNALALLNFPPMKDFVELAKTNPKLQSNGKFDINKIFNKNAHIYSLPSEINGASYCAFFTQVILSDGTLKSVVPSAALVSNKFMDKWSSRQPYYIVAGSTHGRLTWDDSSNRNNWGSLVGPDYNFGREDLDALEPYGVNVITYVPRKGTYINSNQTAKQSPVSALSKIHVRELAIFLQNEIANMLENYHWELNTQTLRDTIKAKADSILETVKNNGGVYDYINICDETNNSNVVVDNEMLVLDTHIEPARGAGKMIHNLTIYRTGEMKSSVQ